MPSRVRILCLALHTPLPADNGDSIRVLGLLRALAARHEVELVCSRRAVTSDEHVRELNRWLGGRLRLFGDAPRPEPGLAAKCRRWVRAVLVGQPPWVREHWNPDVASFLSGRGRADHAVVFLDNPTMIYWRLFRGGAPLVADMHNVQGWSVIPPSSVERPSVRQSARLALAAMLTRRSERRLVSAMDGVIVTSADEADRLTKLY